MIVTGPRLADGVLHLAYRCAAHSPCTGRLRLVVPQHCGIVLCQPSGHVIMRPGSQARCGSARAAWTSARPGCAHQAWTRRSHPAHLSARFVSPPGRVGVTLVSAQATLHLPASATYRLSQQVTSGYVHAGIPQASDSARTIAARINSGELELLPR